MRRSIRANPGPLMAGIFAVLLALAGTQQAQAQSVYFSGFTEGCFGVGCTPTGGSSIFGGLTYSAGTFAVTTVDGFASVGGGTNNFGRFALSGAAQTYTGQSFTLLLTFIDPSSNSNVFTAALTGAVTAVGSGGVFVDFGNATQTWSDANGTYTVMVNDLSVFPGESVSVSGNLTATSTVVPEPISMVLIGTGLAGLGVVRRRRSRIEDADLI
ncbi:hypothetical protein BH23GEM9_BH23GEM9_23080 [soil metagenome]